MTPERAKQLIKELGLNGIEFSSLMGKNINYVTNFKRDGVPVNIAIILNLSKELIDRKTPKKRILEIITKSSENT
jgi:transcriptional regulator with XRE-family HTH domain